MAHNLKIRQYTYTGRPYYGIKGPGVDIRVDPKILSRKYQTTIRSTAGPKRLAAVIQTMVDWAFPIYDQLAADKEVGNIEATANYSKLIKALDNLLTRREGGGVKAAGFGRPSPEQSALLKRHYARLLSGNMTKMNSAVDHLKKLGGDIYQAYDEKHPEREGVVLPWIGKSMPKLIAETASLVNDWLELIELDEKMLAKGSDYHEKRKGLIVSARATPPAE